MITSHSHLLLSKKKYIQAIKSLNSSLAINYMKTSILLKVCNRTSHDTTKPVSFTISSPIFRLDLLCFVKDQDRHDYLRTLLNPPVDLLVV